MSVIDAVVERLARRTAARSTRRSFLGRAGRVAVLVAAGPTLATLISRDEVASARVCGQSGVSPLCATFDCDATWGWCWYASGCCADGLLKKICDCCAPNTPNPVGYCPSGKRVLCVVESCGADPRLQSVTAVPFAERDPVLLSVLLAREQRPDGAPIAVIGDAESAGFAALATSLGRVLDGPVLLSRRDALPAVVGDELTRAGVEFATVVGPLLGPAVDAALVARGIAVERVGTSPDLAACSVEVARHQRDLTGARVALVLLPGQPDTVVAAAGAVAALHRIPLLLGTVEQVRAGLESPRPVRETFVAGTGLVDVGGVPGGRPITGADARGLADRLSTLLLELGGAPDVVVLAAEADAAIAPALGLLQAPVVLHRERDLDGARDFLYAHRDRIRAGRTAARLPDAPRKELQSILNEFEIHLLRGVAGEGLPVIPQPLDERPIGRARR